MYSCIFSRRQGYQW